MARTDYKTNSFKLKDLVNIPTEIVIQQISDLLESRENVQIDLDCKSFKSYEVLNCLRIITEVDEYISHITQQEYKEYGECVAGELIFVNGEETVTF